MSSKLKITPQIKEKIRRQMCRVSEAIYKKHQEKRFGIKACKGKLANETIEDLQENMQILKYFLYTKDRTSVDLTKLIETLT